AFAHYLDLFTLPGVYARGLDVTAFEKDEGEKGASGYAQRLGWSVFGVGAPGAKVAAVARGGAAAWDRPGFRAGLKKRGSSRPPPNLKIGAPPKGLPADTVHLEITVQHAAARTALLPPPGKGPGHRLMLNPYPATPPRPASKPTPVTLHALVIGDG